MNNREIIDEAVKVLREGIGIFMIVACMRVL